ncbi:MAG: TetR/AcrR family transcriptional regulator [Lactobacillus sp.]|nr:TetR/AcrR family transcriptional regulator [Lactobacillus sp.]
MARRKNIKRRREIISNTFNLIRQYGLDDVSLQRIAEESKISKSLLQSYYPHKANLVSEIAYQLLTTLSRYVEMAAGGSGEDRSNPYALTKAYIYLIVTLGMTDNSLNRLIAEAFRNNQILDTWGTMLETWIYDRHVFDCSKVNAEQLRLGISFITAGVGRLYYDRSRIPMDAEAIAEAAARSLMFSFVKSPAMEIKRAMTAGHAIITKLDVNVVFAAIDTAFDEAHDAVNESVKMNGRSYEGKFATNH